MRKRIIILGATGSIGRAALDVVAAMPDAFEVVGLAAGSQVERLAELARRFEVRALAVGQERLHDALQAAAPAARCLSGAAGLVELVESTAADFVLSAIVGAAGLPATLAAVGLGRTIGLANKESLVIAGSLLMPLARERGAAILPVDSEHSAIFQAMQGGRRSEVRRIFLTASGGPFRTWSAADIENATVEDALRHPTWLMGPKVTIDSASMMNKTLEVIEAHHLFGLPADQIEVLVHPQSVVHSMVEFCDGSLLAQLGAPDMKTPIQYALTFPARRPAVAAPMDWGQVQTLDFHPPDLERFPALRLGFEAVRLGGTAGAVLNAANEEAVQRFRDGRMRFGQIARCAAEVLSRHTLIRQPRLDDLMAADRWARQEVHTCLQS